MEHSKVTLQQQQRHWEDSFRSYDQSARVKLEQHLQRWNNTLQLKEYALTNARQNLRGWKTAFDLKDQALQKAGQDYAKLMDRHRALEAESALRDHSLLQAKQDILTAGQHAAATCVICLDEKVNAVFMGCMHAVTCLDCAQRLMGNVHEWAKCPVCREEITDVRRVYLG